MYIIPELHKRTNYELLDSALSIRYHGKKTLTATAATQVAQSTIVEVILLVEYPSFLYSISSWGCFSNSNTSTSKRKRTLELGDSLRQTK